MARTLPILDSAQRKEFENPPRFSYQQRKLFFTLPEWAEQLVKQLFYPHTQVGFVLQVGYFKATGRFFTPASFYKADQQYIRQRYKIPYSESAHYDRATLHRHRQLILSYFGVAAFKEKQQQLILQQAITFAKKQMNPLLIFRTLADFIRSHRIEVPTYATLAMLVTEAFKQVEEEWNELLSYHLSPAIREKLDALLEVAPASTTLPNQPYRLTILKRNLEVMRPAAIKSNVADYLHLKELYTLLIPLLQVLNLSDEMLVYYARFVLRAQVFQVVKQENRKYLMLICFIVYQYFRLSDLLVETLLSAVRTTRNATRREEKERIYHQHHTSIEAMEEIIQGVISHASELDLLEKTTGSFSANPDEKLQEIKNWINSKPIQEFKALKEKAERLKKPQAKDHTYYQALEDKSRSLQKRISDIIRYVDFGLPPEDALYKAIVHFKNKDGILTHSLPAEFLRKAEVQALEKAGSKISLYKVLLATHLADQIKGGKVNVATSFYYKAFESYLIPESLWRRDHAELLEKALLTSFKECPQVLDGLYGSLKTAFATTFERINAGTNTLVEKRRDGKPRFITPAEAEKEEIALGLFPQGRFIPIYEVLHTVNAHCRFTECLTHWNPRYRHTPPNESVFFSGILGYGCNLGIAKMAHTSRHISLNTLENTVNWYFSLENLQRANDAIVALMGRLKITELFREQARVIHSSSDGQKFYVKVDSIHANYSYKYFGKEKGIVIYSFIDEMHRLFYSTTFSSSEREAAYVIDGLMHHPEESSKMHSTDTHGYSEVIFALTHLLGISFAPRIKGFQEQNLYLFEGMEIPALKEYTLKIGAPINTKVIEENWDTLLRIVASIRLKHVSASSLLRRLNSYSRQHPAYQALKELGKVVRTAFILHYMDEEGLRKRIDNQLQKIESAHHFARAVFYGNNGEICFAGKEEHLRSDACKRLIQNAIICWNYLYLTQLLSKASLKERSTIIEAIRQSSPVSWQHINLQGEFDFSEDSLKDSITFDLSELLAVEVN